MKPIIINIQNPSEGVFLDGSGFENPKASIVWTNQNSGSHSDLKILFSSGSKTGNLAITATFVGKGNITFGGASSSYTIDGKSITFYEVIRNQYENKAFTFDNVVFTDTGDGHELDPSETHFGSYYKTNTHCEANGDGDASKDWIVTYSFS